MAVITCNRKRRENEDAQTQSRIDDLNNTLLELIFTRLSPWKYLATSKCVSKRWNSIISNPDFTRQLTPQSFPGTLFLSDGRCLATEHPCFQKHKFPLDFIPSFHILVAYTNNLIVAYHIISCQEGEFYIVNPFTKRYVVVPQPLENQYLGYMIGIAGFVDGVSTVNVSHRNNHNYNHGFRIVGIHFGDLKTNLFIYFSETGQWKTYSIHCICPRWKLIRGAAITLNNKIHWLNYNKILVIDPFNIDNVAPRLVNIPEVITNNSSVLGVCQNRLHIAQFEDTTVDMKNRRIRIYEIEDYDDVHGFGRNYFAKVRLVIDLKLKRSLQNRIFPGISGGYDPVQSHKMVCCHPNDPQVVYFYYDDRLFYCNVVEKKSKEIGSCNFNSNAFVFLHPP